MEIYQFTGPELEDALRNGGIAQSDICIICMVKRSDNNDFVSISCTNCSDWIEFPTDMIESAERIGQSNCNDHSHPIMKIFLKEGKKPQIRALMTLVSHVANHSGISDPRTGVSPPPPPMPGQNQQLARTFGQTHGGFGRGGLGLTIDTWTCKWVCTTVGNVQTCEWKCAWETTPA